MALDGDILGIAIRNTINEMSQEEKEDLETVWKRIGNQIIGHIQTYGVVSPTGTPVPLTAPTGGGPVTGTGKVL